MIYSNALFCRCRSNAAIEDCDGVEVDSCSLAPSIPFCERNLECEWYAEISRCVLQMTEVCQLTLQRWPQFEDSFLEENVALQAVLFFQPSNVNFVNTVTVTKSVSL